MGGDMSTPAPKPAHTPAPDPAPKPAPPPINPEFDKPWRNMNWEKKDEIEQKLRDFKLKQPDIRFVRILLVGDVGTGKSSFINSINNAFQKRITSDALTNTIGGKSFTKIYKTHIIRSLDGSPLPFVFNDVMGLEVNEAGAQSQDIIKALRGYLEEGFNFEDAISKTTMNLGYRSNPSREDQTYCLVNVVAADKVSLMANTVVDKMKKLREAASELNMPQVVIMTRPDLACPLVAADLRKIYSSKKIKEKMEVCSNLLGIPVNYIFPVKNYHQEIDPDNDIDALTLKALEQIVNNACDALRNRTLNSGAKSE